MFCSANIFICYSAFPLHVTWLNGFLWQSSSRTWTFCSGYLNEVFLFLLILYYDKMCCVAETSRFKSTVLQVHQLKYNTWTRPSSLKFSVPYEKDTTIRAHSKQRCCHCKTGWKRFEPMETIICNYGLLSNQVKKYPYHYLRLFKALKNAFPKFQLIRILYFQIMHDYVFHCRGRTWRHQNFWNFSAIQCKFNRWLKNFYMQRCCNIILLF